MYCQHRGSVRIEYSSVEAACVASADAMSHIEHIPSLLKLAYCKRQLSVSEGAKWVDGKISRSWKKLIPEAREIMKEKYEFAKEMLSIYKD